MLRHHRSVVNDILCLDKIKRVVKARRGKLHLEFIGQPVKRHKIRRIPVLHRHAETDILHSHGTQLLKRRISPVESIRETADFIIGLLQAFDGDADTNLRKLPAQIKNPVCEETICRNHNPVRLFQKFTHNILQICTDKWLSPRDIGEIHLRKLPNRLKTDLFLRL